MNNNFKSSFTVLLALLISACGSAAPTPAPEKPATPLSTVSMDDRVMATFNTKEHPLASPTLSGNHPDELVIAADDMVWTHMDNGYLVQFNWFSNTMSGAVKTDTTTDRYHYCQGLGSDGTDVWACSAAGDEDNTTINVVRVDASKQEVVETFEVGKIQDQLYMPFAQNQIWVLTGDGSKLVGIDVSTNQVNPAIDLGVRCFQLTSLGSMLYASCGVDNLVLKIDAENKEVVLRQTVNSPRTLTAASNGVWVCQGNSITRLDPETLNPIVTFTGITDSDIAASANAVWVWEYNKALLYKIDPNTNEIVELIKPEKPFIAGGGVLLTEDSLWLTANENDIVLRLNLK